ncbi:MAG: hypothetical protein SVT52_03055 [Planctomycetota bacterium]|nr:hypothetical protein [Planctomycetota bacterium]
MKLPDARDNGECPDRCTGCASSDARPTGPEAGEPLSGWRLGLLAALVFLWPLALAVAGALLGEHSGLGEAAGGLAGLAIGLASAAVIAKATARSLQERVPSDDNVG